MEKQAVYMLVIGLVIGIVAGGLIVHYGFSGATSIGSATKTPAISSYTLDGQYVELKNDKLSMKNGATVQFDESSADIVYPNADHQKVFCTCGRGCTGNCHQDAGSCVENQGQTCTKSVEYGQTCGCGWHGSGGEELIITSEPTSPR